MNSDAEKLVSDVMKEQPKTDLKGVDYVELASAIIQIVIFLIKQWKTKHPQSEAKRVGPLKRLILKNAVRRANPDLKFTDSIFKSTLDAIASRTDQEITSIKGALNGN